MPFVIVGLIIIITVLLVGWMRRLPDEQVKRLKQWLITGTLLVLAALILLRGAPLIAAALSIIAVTYNKIALISTIAKKLLGRRAPVAPSSSISMTREDACAILNVSGTATHAEIKEAYYNAMKRNHPDEGGSDYIAAQINRAKEILLGK